MLPRTAKQTAKTAQPDRWEVAELIAAAVNIPRVEMPNAETRTALLAAIRSGEVIGVYRPLGGLLDNIELHHDLRAGNPRLSCDAWAARVNAKQGGQG